MLICGIDEAGRGPLAGPVVAAAVIFEDDFVIDNVNDSKVLSENERDRLFYRILDKCLDYGIGIVNNDEIDRINILQATMKAMSDAISNLNKTPDIYLIDGNYFKLKNNEQERLNYRTIIKGDSSVFQISCASIIAKVTRDNIMKGYHLKYPEYGFHRHKGYATSEHYSGILKFGISEIHRKSFLKNFPVNQNNENYEMHL